MTRKNSANDREQREDQGRAGPDFAWFQNWIKQQNLRQNDSMDLCLRVQLGNGSTATVDVTYTVGPDEDGWIIVQKLREQYGTVRALFINADADPIHPVTESRPHTVPRWGEILLMFTLPEKQRHTLPGDLAEEYTTVIVPKMGVHLARVWYWWQVVRSVPWVRIAALYEFIQWKIGR